MHPHPYILFFLITTPSTFSAESQNKIYASALIKSPLSSDEYGLSPFFLLVLSFPREIEINSNRNVLRTFFIEKRLYYWLSDAKSEDASETTKKLYRSDVFCVTEPPFTRGPGFKSDMGALVVKVAPVTKEFGLPGENPGEVPFTIEEDEAKSETYSALYFEYEIVACDDCGAREGEREQCILSPGGGKGKKEKVGSSHQTKAARKEKIVFVNIGWVVGWDGDQENYFFDELDNLWTLKNQNQGIRKEDLDIDIIEGRGGPGLTKDELTELEEVKDLGELAELRKRLRGEGGGKSLWDRVVSFGRDRAVCLENIGVMVLAAVLLGVLVYRLDFAKEWAATEFS